MSELSHLDELEAEAIYIIREVAAECEKPVMLYSIGKDSSVMLHLAMKAFYPEKPPFPFLHVNTTWKFKEMIEFRDRRAKELGDYLIVAVSSDEFNLGKGKVCKIKDTDRMAIVEAIKYVDKVIPETSWEQKIEDVKKYNVDVFVMGDDWKGKFDFLKEYCEVVYLPRTEGISTTQLKEELKK